MEVAGSVLVVLGLAAIVFREQLWAIVRAFDRPAPQLRRMVPVDRLKAGGARRQPRVRRQLAVAAAQQTRCQIV